MVNFHQVIIFFLKCKQKFKLFMNIHTFLEIPLFLFSVFVHCYSVYTNQSNPHGQNKSPSCTPFNLTYELYRLKSISRRKQRKHVSFVFPNKTVTTLWNPLNRGVSSIMRTNERGWHSERLATEGTTHHLKAEEMMKGNRMTRVHWG